MEPNVGRQSCGVVSHLDKENETNLIITLLHLYLSYHVLFHTFIIVHNHIYAVMVTGTPSNIDNVKCNIFFGGLGPSYADCKLGNIWSNLTTT